MCQQITVFGFINHCFNRKDNLVFLLTKFSSTKVVCKYHGHKAVLFYSCWSSMIMFVLQSCIMLQITGIIFSTELPVWDEHQLVKICARTDLHLSFSDCVSLTFNCKIAKLTTI